MSTVKISWSGGKDSTASVILHSQSGDICKIVYYIPMLTDCIPLIRKAHYDFIQAAVDRFTGFGMPCYQAHGMTYWDHVNRFLTKGPRKGQIMGYGLGYGFCLFRDYSKRRALNGVNVGYFDYLDIGIAADECSRYGQLTKEKRSILVERHVTEARAKEICIEHGLLSPIYKDVGRDGCVICPNAGPPVIQQWARDYPQGVEILKHIEHIADTYATKGKIYRDGTKWSDRICASITTE